MRTIAILMLAGMLGGCSGGDGKGDEVRAAGGGTARTYPVSDFSGVTLAGGDDVDVRVGTGFSVRAEGPGDELDKLRIARDGDSLRIDRKDRALISWHSARDAVKVYVTMPRLAAVTLSGSGTMAVDRVEGAKFAAELSGSGDLNIAALNSDTADLSVAGSGDIHAAGAIERLEATVRGSGGLDAAGLRAKRAEISLAGSGDVRANVSDEAKVELRGSGDVDLGATARCTIDKKGSGEVRCGR